MSATIYNEKVCQRPNPDLTTASGFTSEEIVMCMLCGRVLGKMDDLLDEMEEDNSKSINLDLI